MKIVVEVVNARVVCDDLRYRMTKTGHAKVGDPMTTARAAVAAAFPELWLHEAVVHSTSWRYDEESLVLTFLAYSDKMPPDALPLSLPLASVADKANDGGGPSAVAAHAIRHLAFLVATEPREFTTKIRESTLAQLRRIAPDVSRRLGAEAA